MPRLAPILLLSGCFGGPQEILFPPGLEPLEPNTAPWPEGEDHPEQLVMVGGERDGYDWVHARGWLRAPLADVADALEKPDAVVDRRAVDEWTVEWDVEPAYPVSFVVHNVVHDIVTVEFDVTWRQGVVAGAPDDPDAVAARFMKTDDSPFIALMEGSVLLTREGDALTGVEMIERLASMRSDQGTVESTLRDLFFSLHALAHGEELPAY